MFCSSSDSELSVWAGRARFAPPPHSTFTRTCPPLCLFSYGGASERRVLRHAPSAQGLPLSLRRCVGKVRRNAYTGGWRGIKVARDRPPPTRRTPKMLLPPCFQAHRLATPRPDKNSHFLCIPAWETPRKRQLAHGADGVSNDVPPPIVAVFVSTASDKRRPCKCLAPSHRGCFCIYCQR